MYSSIHCKHFEKNWECLISKVTHSSSCLGEDFGERTMHMNGNYDVVLLCFSVLSSTVLTAWTTRPWESSSRALLRQVPGPASMSSTALSLRYVRSSLNENLLDKNLTQSHSIDTRQKNIKKLPGRSTSYQK